MANFNFFLNRQGIQGRKGEKGDTGFSPTISVGTDTLDEYKLIIANESNSFETPNLRGNINIQDNGGTYLRYDTETKQISAQSIDAATADTLGGVRLSTEADIVEMGADSVVTPSDVADALPLYLEGEGAVTITQDELTSKTKIKVDVSSVNDLESRMSTAEAEIADIQTDVADLNNNKVAKTDLATTESAGIVKVDGTSITVTADGTISASPSDTLPIASTTQLGGVKVDGTSIIADKNGVISSVGGGSAGDVTANGNNVFTGYNKFKKDVTIVCDSFSGSSSLALVDSAVDPNTDCATLRMNYVEGLTINSHGEGIKLNTYLSKSQIEMSRDGNICFASQNPLMHRNFRGSGISFPLINQDNIKAGENITLNKNAETGDITISSTGGGGGTGDVPIATTETAGKVKPDGTTITITDDGTISAVADGGSAPANMVTTNTDQDITGKKTIVNSGGLCIKSTNSSVASVTAQIVNTASSVFDTIGTVTIAPNKSSGSRYGFARISYGLLNGDNSNYPLYGKGGFQVTPVVDDTSAEARILLGSPYSGMGNIVGTTSGLTIGTGAVGRELSITPTDITFNGQSLLNSGGETPANMVTTDTEQTITANKTFSLNSVVTFGAGRAKTTIERNSITLGEDNYNIALLPGRITEEDGTESDTGIITSKVGTINIVPDWRTQIRGDGLVIQENSFRFNKNEVVTKSASDNEYMAHMAMPSNRCVTLTLGASGATYTAPADGYFCYISDATTKAGQNCRLIEKGNQRLRQSCYSSGAGQYIEVSMPVSKGRSIHVYHTAPVDRFSFIYAEGAHQRK